MSYAADAPLLATDLAFWHQGLYDPDYPIAEMGKLSQEMVQKFRALAIMLLLSEGSTDLFLHNLSRAGKARLAYLRRLAAADVSTDFFQGSGRYAGLTAAVAALDWTTASEIVSLSPSEKRPGEYEDDYCFAQAIGHLLGAAPPDAAALTPLFDRFEAYLEGTPDRRLDVVRAITAKDAVAFDLAFDGLLVQFEAGIRKAMERNQLEEPVTLALREVDVDAIALLRLAERHGLQTADEYPFCPSLARRPMRTPFPPV